METTPQPLRIALLVLAASLLGIGVLWADGARRGGGLAQAAPTSAAAATPAVRAGLDGSIPAASTATGTLVADQQPATAPAVLARRGGVACAAAHRVVSVPRELPVRAAPNGRAIGRMPSASLYLGQSMAAWVQATTPDGRWGRITIPWGKRVSRSGWIALDGLQQRSTKTLVVGDLSDRRISVYRGCRLIYSVPSAIGAPGSPSPQGRFWVTDRIAVPKSQPYFGSYAFGLSTIQPNPPPGWTGGNQMAIHGTNTPQMIGTAASAGCLRVGEPTLARLKPLLRPGTPVVIQA